MSRVGTNLDKSSDLLEARMLPNVEQAKKDDGGGEIDLAGDGVHKIYLHRAQLEMYNWQARTTYCRAARGFGKTSFIGVHMTKCVLGLPRQMGGFCGASAKQLYCRTMPNALKVIDQLGFNNFYFIGRPPAKLHWDTPLATPRVYENCVSFSNGMTWQCISLAIRGSANGLNLAALIGDETKYLPWGKVKEEVLPTLRGDFLPKAYRKTETKKWGYGTQSSRNPYWLSQLWVSDAGLTQRQREWEKERDNETKEINEQIAEMLAELKYLERHDPKMALKLAENDNYLKKLNALRANSIVFWNWASTENISLLGKDFIAQMKRELPDLMFRITVMGQLETAAKDGWYSNFDEGIHTYLADEMSVNRDAFSLIADTFTVRQKGESLDNHRWPTKWERDGLDLEQARMAADDCSMDVDLDYDSPLIISVDCNANLNCMVVGQTRMVQGKPTLLVLHTFYVMNERKLISLVKEEFTKYYRPYLRRSKDKHVIFLWTPTIKQGGSVAYAVEGAQDYRFDKVVERELKAHGWSVDSVECKVAFHEEKYRIINECLSGTTYPAIRINKEGNDLLICAIQQAEIVPGTYRKDKSREKYGQNKNGHTSDYEGSAGDPRTRTDVTDAFDDMVMGVKFYDTYKKKVGAGLRGRFKNVIVQM